MLKGKWTQINGFKEYSQHQFLELYHIQIAWMNFSYYHQILMTIHAIVINTDNLDDFRDHLTISSSFDKPTKGRSIWKPVVGRLLSKLPAYSESELSSNEGAFSIPSYRIPWWEDLMRYLTIRWTTLHCV